MSDPVPAAPSQRERLLVIGGRLHGETVEVNPGATSWVDLLSAETYYRAGFPYIAADPQAPQSISRRKGYRMACLVHEDIHGDPNVARAFLQSLALLRVYAEHGTEVPWESIAHPQGARPAGGPNADGKAN